MKPAVLLLTIASLALTVPAVADARPDGKNRGERAERRAERVFRDRPGREAPGPVYRPRGEDDDGPGQGRGRGRGRPWGDSLGSGWREQQNEARQGVRQGRFVPLNRVLPNLQRRMPGRQLDAGIEQGRMGEPVYRVRWAGANGRRVDFIVDARTGAILGTEGQ